MNLKRIFGDHVSGRGAIGLLVVRLIIGLALVIHGYAKFSGMGGPFGWMGPDAPVPGFLQGLAVLSELGGGLALIVGLLVPLASLGIAITMLFAIFAVHLKAGHPFVNPVGGPSYELAAAYLAVAILMLITGPGALSLDALLFGRKREARTESLSGVGSTV